MKRQIHAKIALDSIIVSTVIIKMLILVFRLQKSKFTST